MISLFITFVIVFLGTTLFGHIAHWALHQSWAGQFNLSHMTHHQMLYPSSDFMSDKYRDPGKDNTVIIFAKALIPIIIIPIVLGIYGIISWFLVCFSILEMATIGFFNDYLHDSFHIKKHFLGKLPIIKSLFKRWRYLHYLHHVNMKKNFGIFMFFLDKLFGTFWDRKQ